MAKSPEELAHVEWLGYVQPVGLVVSIPAMLEAQCYVNKNIMGEHARFLRCLPRDASDAIVPEIRDLAELTQTVFGWEPTDLVEVPQRVALDGGMESLEVVLPQYHETLRPTHVVPVFKPAEGQSPWMMLVQDLAVGVDFDQPDATDSARHWNAAPQAKFERLLRETGVPIGLMSNRRSLRLVFAPRGESSGHATFNVDEMAQVAGRPMFAALHMLFSAERMFSLGDNQRLPAILENSRKYQNTVSTKLAEQVLAALYELIRGFQSANDVRGGDLLRQILADNPNHVYSGLLTVLMRLVFVMYAEDRDLMSSDPVYTNHYSVTGLFDRLRNDFGRHPDTMDQRYGAWSQLVTLFRLVYEGGQHGDFKLPARKGYLFDPDRYPFLEGRTSDEPNADDQRSTILPRVSDAVVYNALRNLLILDGERLSYRTLDVEQIGSVYETVMGFNLEVAGGRSIAIKPVKTHGAPATINLDALLATPGKDRDKWLKEHADQTVGTAAAKQLKDAGDLKQLLEALDKKVSKKVTPRVVPAGAMVLQPSDERRRSGSHYTPRSLTEPIVRTTLEPVLKQLCDPETELPAVYQPTKEDKRRYTTGELAARVRQSERSIEIAKEARRVGTPHPSQILSLKVCDPAMGSGAFLVETCRQLGDELIKAWYAHDAVPTDIPPDEDELLYARRMIAQRCLYGVDKNIMAVDLAKLSLWLVTLAKDHAFTFLDHALRYGDSLVGLTREQIIGFHWEPKKQKQFGEDLIQKRLDKATEARAKILNAREDVAYRDQEQRMAIANEALNLIRLVGDACVSCFFAADKKKAREDELERVFGLAGSYLSSLTTNNQQLTTNVDFQSRAALHAAADRLKPGPHPVPCFHWDIEFPEVFSRDNGGFDAFVGNPPFAGRTTLYEGTQDGYLDWLKETHPGTHGNADLVAHFFRGAFALTRRNGCFGFIATNTIGQGDTRATGLTYICENDGTIFNATKRLPWPGQAAVVVSVVHVIVGELKPPYILDRREVPKITAYLFHAGGNKSPNPLVCNKLLSFQGPVVVGTGFTFDDRDTSGKASSLQRMEELLEKSAINAERIFPYIGGEEILNDPRHRHHRFVINFDELPLIDAKRRWPDLIQILEEKVKPEREESLKKRRSSDKEKRALNWWLFSRTAKALQTATASLGRVLVHPFTSSNLAFTFLPKSVIVAGPHNVFALERIHDFSNLQCRVHEVWVRFVASSMKDDLRYTATDCFETFPRIEGEDEGVSNIGQRYFDFRAKLLLEKNSGLSSTYNRFHDPGERDPGIFELRRLHGEMDQVVLRAYDWQDLADQAAETDFCQFLLDYEEDDDNSASDSRSTRQKKKPWRYRWPDDFRDEVLARLLALNEQRHQDEMLAVGSPLSKAKKQTANKSRDAKKASRNSVGEDTPLFDSSNQSAGR